MIVKNLSIKKPSGIILISGIMFVFSYLLVLDCMAGDPKKVYYKYEDVTGYINITELSAGKGLGATSGPYTASYAGITMVNGYVIDRHFLTGIGLGLHSYSGGMLIPVYLDIRYVLNRNDFTPFVYGDGGGFFNVEGIKKYGLFLNPGIGVIKQFSDKLALSLSAGMLVQSYPVHSSFINVKLGLVFRNNSGDPCKIPYKKWK